MGAWIAETVDGFWSLDGRAPRTFGQLLLQPGRLTVDDWQQRRARHLSPLRVYLISSFALFLVVGVVGRTTGAAGFQGGLVQITLPEASAELPPVDWQAATDAAGPLGRAVIEQIARPAYANPGRVNDLMNRLPWFFFSLVPLFAVELRVLFWRRGVRLAEHLVFSLHAHSVFFLLVTAENLLRLAFRSPLAAFLLGLILALINIVHLGAALRQAYSISARSAALCTVLLVTVHGCLLTGALLFATWWTLQH